MKSVILPQNAKKYVNNKSEKSSFLCGSKGHFARECQKKQSGMAATEIQEQCEGDCQCLKTDCLTLPCGKQVPLFTGSCQKAAAYTLPITKGIVNGKFVDSMRDTGCTGVVVREALVDEDQFLDTTQTCMLINGSIMKVRVAKVNIDTPYFCGEVHAMCMRNPIYDLIIGNVPGALPADQPNQDWSPPEVSAVVTRAQTYPLGYE